MRFQAWIFVALFLVGGTAATVIAFLLGFRAPIVMGETSEGHRLLEPRCESCHASWGAIPSERCISCHRTELANDIHAPRIFEDPDRWAGELAALEARECVTCHLEHRPAPIGFTGEAEICEVCHGDITRTSTSHRAMKQEDCLSCHNYHDEGVIARPEADEHLEDPSLVDARLERKRWLRRDAPWTRDAPDAPQEFQTPKINEAWASSAHARQGINCKKCHAAGGASWASALDERSCEGCHEIEVQSFHQGKHGVRPSLGLDPILTTDARLPMQEGVLAQGCGGCHGVHDVDMRRAQVEACLVCHADEHSSTYLGSPHGRAYREGRLDAPTCATCHLPYREVMDPKRPGLSVNVAWHNNSFTMRPLERMLTDVCVRCHGLAYSWSALRDEIAVKSSFSSRGASDSWSARHMDMIRVATEVDRTTEMEGVEE